MAIRYELSDELAEEVATTLRGRRLTLHQSDDRDTREVVTAWLEEQVAGLLRRRLVAEAIADSDEDAASRADERLEELGIERGRGRWR